MLVLSTEERLALLLSVIGQDVADKALKSMNPTRANYVSKIIDEYRLEPPSKEEVDYIVQDFSSYFSFAMEALGPEINAAQELEASNNKRKPKTPVSKNTKNETVYFEPLTPSNDVVADLNQLDAFQIARVLADDHPKTVALVLRNLDTSLAAKVVESLPANLRNESVIFLSQSSTVSDRIVEQVLKTTFANANSVNAKIPVVDQSQMLAELMRTLDKDMRQELIEKLSENNEELVNEIRSKLYIFDDLMRLNDRDMQKVLGEIEMDNLIVALQNANPELKTKLMDNLSKRARQTIEEEMQYKTGVSPEEIEDARTQVVAVVAKLDETGDITLS